MAGPGRFRRWLVRPFGWSLALLALGLGLLGWSLRSGWLAERVRVLAEVRLSEAIGRRVHCERLELSLVPLTLEAWGVRVAGPRPEAPPLAEIGHLAVSAEVEGFGRPRLTVQEVLLERPVFRLGLLAEGSDDLPRLGRSSSAEKKPAAESRVTTEERLTVRLAALEIRDGWFDLGDERVPLTVAARGVAADLVGMDRGLLGRVEVARAEVVLPGAKPYAARVAARVGLYADRLEMREVGVEGEDLSATVEGEVRWRGKSSVRLAGHVAASDELARDLGVFDFALAGRVEADAELRWESGAPWTVQGSFAVPALDFWNLGIEQVNGTLALGADELTLDVADARALGGNVVGHLRFDFTSHPTTLALDLHLAEVAVERLLASRDIALGAPLDADLAGRVHLEIPLGEGGDVTGGLELAAAPRGREGAVAFSGPVRFELGGGQLSALEVALAGEAGSVTATGSYALDPEVGEFDYSVATEQVGALARLLPVTVDPAAPPLWLPSAGSGRIRGRLRLAGEGVSTRLELDLEKASAPGLAADEIVGAMSVDAGGLGDLRLVARQGGSSLRVDGHVPFSEGAPLALKVALAAWPSSALEPWLPLALPIAGPVRGDLALGGTLAALTGQAHVALAPAAVSGLAVDALEAELAFDPETVVVRSLVMRLPAGELRGSGRYQVDDEGLDLRIVGERLSLAAAPLSALAAVPLGGEASLEATLRGRMAEPDLELVWRTRGVRGAGMDLPESKLGVAWKNGSLAVQGSLLGVAEVEGGGELTHGKTALSLGLTVPDLPRLGRLAGLPADLDLTGRLAGTLRAEGDLLGTGEAHWQLELPRAEVGLAGYRLSALEPVRLDLGGDRIEIRSLYFGEQASGAELVLAGHVGIGGEGPLDLRLQASLPAAMLGRFAPGLTLAGQIDALGALRGTFAHPRVSGQAELAGGRIILPDFPHTIDQVRASLLFSHDGVTLDSLSAELGGGRLRGGGTLLWERADGLPGPEYRFQLAAEKVSLRYPAGWLLRGDADLTLLSLDDGRLLRGSVRLDRAYFLQDLPANLGQVLGRLLERQRLSAGATDEVTAGTSLALTLQAPQALRVRNNLADLRGSAELTVRGTLAQPAVFGRVEAERGGKIVYSGNEYKVERARLTFSNPLRIEPVVDLEARAKVDEYQVTMALAGTLERLAATFTSDPPLPSLDVVGLLAVGAPVSSTEGAAPLPSATATVGGSGSLQAEALLYSQAASIISSRVEGLFGLDKVRIDPLTTSRDVVSSARITVGKRLSRSLYVTYSIDPSTSEQQQVQVEWQVSDQLLVVLTQNGAESYAADLRWERRF